MLPFYFQFFGCLCSFSANFPVNICVLSCSISLVSLIATYTGCQYLVLRACKKFCTE